jgi:hypothetical protein
MIVKKDKGENGGGSSGGRARRNGYRGRVIIVVSSLFKGLLKNGTPNVARESCFEGAALTQNYELIRESAYRRCNA